MVAASGILAMATIFAYVIVKILATIPAEELRTLKAENEMLLGSIQSLKYLNEMEEEIGRNEALAQKAVGNQPDWVALFYAISESIPDAVKLTQVSTNTEKDKAVMTLQGDARSQSDIAVWMGCLKDDDLLNTAELLSTRASGDRVMFEVKITLKSDKPFKLFEEAQE